jgi:hypothetical protein
MIEFNEQAIRELFDRATTAMRSGDYLTAADCCDPVSLALFKRERLWSAEPKDWPPWTIEQFRRTEPDAPPAVAEYYVAKYNRHRDAPPQVLQEFPRFSTVDELRALEPAEFFAEYLYGRSPEHTMKWMVDVGELPAHALAELPPMDQLRPGYHVIGVLPDDHPFAHVVYRQMHRFVENADGNADDADDPEWAAMRETLTAEEREYQDQQVIGPILVATCRKQGDGSWKLIADRDFLGPPNSTFSIGFEPGPPDHFTD